MNITGAIKILKDDRGIYKTTLVGKEIQQGTNEEEKIFMQINVGFRKGVELKNKSRINVKDGFITLFRVQTDELKEDGTPRYKYFPKFMIMDFDLLEDGIDELQTSKKQVTQQTTPATDDVFGGYYSDDTELPF